jgi:hypothetical protein
VTRFLTGDMASQASAKQVAPIGRIDRPQAALSVGLCKSKKQILMALDTEAPD